ncbi:hypothetical protein BD414DRAFT_499939 [Trametes punicea]|nr:hypothetical protein BD414DRAFT_499939 [Trametes punicea]
MLNTGLPSCNGLSSSAVGLSRLTSSILSWTMEVCLHYPYHLLSTNTTPDTTHRSPQLQLWAIFLGIPLALVAALQYALRIAHTYRLKLARALSIPVMPINTPGEVLIVSSIALIFVLSDFLPCRGRCQDADLCFSPGQVRIERARLCRSSFSFLWVGDLTTGSFGQHGYRMPLAARCKAFSSSCASSSALAETSSVSTNSVVRSTRLPPQRIHQVPDNRVRRARRPRLRLLWATRCRSDVRSKHGVDIVEGELQVDAIVGEETPLSTHQEQNGALFTLFSGRTQ